MCKKAVLEGFWIVDACEKWYKLCGLEFGSLLFDAVCIVTGECLKMKERGDVEARGCQSAALRPDGFTLTELLVALSLGAMLAGMMLPALNTAQDTMKAAVCLGNMHQWGLAIGLYTADQKDYYPYVEIGRAHV